MATVKPTIETRPKTRYDHIFFPALAVLIAASAFIGFAQTYYLHGLVRVPASKAVLAPPFPWIVHVHAIVFSSWIVLLIVQTSLVATHRVGLHRQLGLIGFGLACLMLPIVLAAICTELVRLYPPSQSPMLPWYQFVDLAVFSTLVYFGYGQRRNPAAHKRLVMIGTIALLDAAFARWPLAIANQHHMDDFACFFLVLLIGGYDLFCNRKLHWVTASGGALLVLAKYPIRSLLYAYLPGHRAALYMQVIGRHLL